MEPPRQASLFQRPREPEAVLHGAEKLAGRRSLELPLHARIIALEFHGLASRACEGCQLRLELMPAREPSLRIQLLLENVRELTVPHLPAEGLDIAFFDIEDVRTHGWPEVNWRVGEIVSEVPDPLTGQLPAPRFQCYAERAEVVGVVMEG